MPLEQTRKEYVERYKTVMSAVVQATVTLFCLNLPSITAADEALIALAEPGGAELNAAIPSQV